MHDFFDCICMMMIVILTMLLVMIIQYNNNGSVIWTLILSHQTCYCKYNVQQMWTELKSNQGLHWRQSIIHILWNISHDSWYILHKQVFIEYRIRKPVSRLVSENIRHDSLHFTFIISDFSSHVHLWNVDFAQ